MEADWISLMDYANKYGVSLSTLRRHIKSGKIQYKSEGGRYLLKCSEPVSTSSLPPYAPSAPISGPSAAAGATAGTFPNAPSNVSSQEVRELNAKLQRAHEEISELKMLIAIYEEQISQERPQPPSPQLRMNG